MLEQTSGIMTVLAYYAIINLCSIPLTIILISILHRKTNWLGPVDKFIDEVLLGKKTPEAKPEETGDRKEANMKPEPPVDEMDKLWKQNELRMACIRLRVGDTYRCRLNEYDIRNAGNGPEWKTTDRFVGTIDHRGTFTARKTGRTTVEFGESEIYYIDIAPTFTHEAGRCCDDIVKARTMDHILARSAMDGVQPADIDRKKHRFRLRANGMTYLYSTDDDNTVDRCLVTLKDTDKAREAIKSMMRERMNLALDKDGEVFWIHMEPDTISPEYSVDATAFMKKSVNGELMFGITRCWRIGCPEGEALSNLDMILVMFKGMMPDEDVPTNLRERKFIPETRWEKPARKKHTRKIKKEPEGEHASEIPSEEISNMNGKDTPEDTEIHEETGSHEGDDPFMLDPMYGITETEEPEPYNEIDIDDPTI